MFAKRIVWNRQVHRFQHLATPLFCSTGHLAPASIAHRHSFLHALTHKPNQPYSGCLHSCQNISPVPVPTRNDGQHHKHSIVAACLELDQSTHDLCTGPHQYISQVRWQNQSLRGVDQLQSAKLPFCSSIPVNTTHNAPYLFVNTNLFNYASSIKGPGMLGVSGICRSRVTSHFPSLPKLFSPLKPHSGEEQNILNSTISHKKYLSNYNIDVGLSDFYSGRLSNSSNAKRLYHTTATLFVEPSSQVEVTVNALKEKAQDDEKAKKVAEDATTASAAATPPSVADDAAPHVTANETVSAEVGPEVLSTSATPQKAGTPAPSTKGDVSTTALVVEKKSIWTRVKEEILHYYHGFRLLFIDTKICIKYCYRVLNGDKLSRREHRQLVRTTGDLFRLLPFSVFIIVPFMELLLPVAIKLFPGMLPSTFETANEKEAKIKKQLKVKLEMAKFLQETLDSMSLQGKGHKSQSAKEFVLFFEKVRRTGEHVTNEEILKFSKLFADAITLDSLARPQLTAICRLLEMQPFGTNNFLRFQLRMKLRSLAADDKLIAVEGVDSLSSWELQQACRFRGMRAYGMTDTRLRLQLKQWLELSLDKQVPPSLLLLSRTLYMPDSVDTNTTLAETIKRLPDEVKTRTKAAIGKREGKIDNRTRLEVIQGEEKRIQEDKKDMEDEKKKKEAKKKGELGIGLVEVVSVGGPTSPSSLHPPLAVDAPQQPPTAEAIIAKAVKVTKATVTSSGELKEDKDLLVDKAPVLEDKAPVMTTETAKEKQMKKDKDKSSKEADEELSSEDLAEVEEALETISAKQKRLLIEEQELSELKEEMQDYQQDIEDFKQVVAQYPERAEGLRESKAARRLFAKVNRLIAQAEPVIGALSDKTKEMQRVVEAGDADKQHRATLVNLEELVTHLRQVADAPDSAKLTVIRDVLTAMDTDNDGAIKLEHIMKALELLSEDQVGVPPKVFEEVIQAMAKEEQLETKTVVQRAIVASKTVAVAATTESGGKTGGGDVAQQKQ